MVKVKLTLLISLIVLISPQAALAETLRAGKLGSRLAEMARSYNGRVGIAVIDIASDSAWQVNGEQLFPMASVYKVPILVELYNQQDEGKIDLSEKITIDDKINPLGSGLLKYFAPGAVLSWRDLAHLMIVVSDNAATDLILKLVGAENVTKRMKQLGLEKIRVDRTTERLIMDYLALARPELSGRSGREFVAESLQLTAEEYQRADAEFPRAMKDVASPLDISRLLAKIYKNEAASKEACREMLNILGRQQFKQRLPRYLPRGALVGNKTGTIGPTVNDAAVIVATKKPVALTVFITENRGTTEQAEEFMARVGRLVFDYFDLSSQE